MKTLLQLDSSKRSAWETKRCPRPMCKAGFALIATISVMILLVMVALAMLSMSMIEQRASRSQSAKAEAQANARLALMLALAELQSVAGPDQRITASASILDSEPHTPSTQGLLGNSSSNLLGVWESWGNWLNAEHKGLKITNTYKAGRDENLFKRWLVSYQTPDTAEQWDAPISGSGSGFSFVSDESVEMLSDGSLGQNSDPAERVVAGLIPTARNGRYAWWIGSENQKARTAMPERNLNDKKSILLGTDSIGRAAPEELDDLNGLPTGADTQKQITLPTLRVAAGINADQAGRYFSHLSPYSASVMTDVRHGGTKKDLSLLFERNVLPAPMVQTSKWEPGVRPYSPDLLAHNIRRPERTLMSWEQMFEYYRIYRADAASQGVTARMEINGENPTTRVWVKHATSGSDRTTHNEKGYARSPVLLRLYSNIGLQTQRIGGAADDPLYRCYVTYTPVVTLWNPYNVEMKVRAQEINSMTLLYKICPLAYMPYKGSVAQSGWVPFSQDYSAYGFGGDWGSNIMKSPNQKGAEMIIPPGGIIVYSHHTARLGLGNKYQELFEGFDPGSISKYRAVARRLETVRPSDNPGIALRFNRVSAPDDYPSWTGGNPGSIMVRLGSPFASYGQSRPGEYSLGFAHNLQFLNNSQGYTNIVPTSSASLARFQFSDNEPVIIGAVGLTAKSGSLPAYDSHVTWKKDWRNKTWLHASPGFWGSQLMNPTDRNRAAHPFITHWQQVGGGAGVAEIVPHIGRYGFLGGGESDGERVSRAAIFELPTAPISSLAGFAGLRLTPGWWDERGIGGGGFQSPHGSWSSRRLSYQSGVPGVGIGNSFADPMITANGIYQYHDNSRHFTGTSTEGHSDFWDHGLLANDALYDSYFLSSVATEPAHMGTSRTAGAVAREFFEQDKPLHNSSLIPWQGDKTDTELTALAAQTDGWEKLSGHLMLKGGFNVNSTNLSAWKALLYGLIDRPLVYRQANGNLATLTPPTGQAVLSRFHAPQTNQEMDDPITGVDMGGINGWSGVRYLTRDDLDLLAEKCVEQVKLRGPFLNMSEFINRRLSNDDLGLAGALQRAIDYDDDAPESKSINYRYKVGSYRITDSDVAQFSYPNSKAATGSRYTAIPGYVVQSDVLQALDSTLVVRDDTFRIRSYGESRNADGSVAARAWCEAIVQRTPDYLDPTNENHEPATILDGAHVPAVNPALTDTNRNFGRRFRIVSFRWLHQDEV
ncbi:MAG: hypothetical protein ACPG32_13235 [Akkermansiaceae bacterium]